MKRTVFTVNYVLNEETVNRIKELAKRWRSTGREITTEELFDFAMTMLGNVQQNLDLVDRFLERKGV